MDELKVWGHEGLNDLHTFTNKQINVIVFISSICSTRLKFANVHDYVDEWSVHIAVLGGLCIGIRVYVFYTELTGWSTAIYSAIYTIAIG